MSKQEFLDKLRAALSGNVPAKLVEENVAYYSDYINAQIRVGRSEESVLQSLGEPRLIAKSIITANSGEEYIKNGYTSSNNEFVDDRYYAETREQKLPRVVRLHGWAALIVLILILVLVFGAIYSLISLFFPLIVMGGIVYFFIKVFKDWLK